MTVNEPAQFDLATFLRLVRRRAWLIAGVVVLSAGLAFGLSSLQDEKYEARAALLFRAQKPAPTVDPNEPPPDVQDSPERVAATNLALASRDSVASRVKRRLNSPLNIDDLRDRVKLEPKGQANIIEVKGSAESPPEAVRLTDAFAEEIVSLRRKAAQERVQNVIDAIRSQVQGTPAGSGVAQQLRRRASQLEVEKKLTRGDVEIAERPIQPIDPSSPKPVRNAAIGGALGLLLGILLAVLLSRFDRRVRGEEEAAEIVGAPTLARVPLDGDSEVEQQLFLEAFQFLRANVQLRDPERRRRVIAITSALPGHGKSTVAAELASALALSGSDVVLVDCDLRRPSLHEHFHVEGDEGVTSVVVGRKRPVHLLKDTALPGLRLLPAGPLMPIPASIMTASQHISTIFNELSSEADYVLVDTSPVPIGADASAVCAAADGVLMVVDADRIDRDVLRVSREQLESSGAEIVGLVLNRAEVLLRDSDYRNYYQAGKSAGVEAPPESKRRRRRGRKPAEVNSVEAPPESKPRRRRGRKPAEVNSVEAAPESKRRRRRRGRKSAEVDGAVSTPEREPVAPAPEPAVPAVPAVPVVRAPEPVEEAAAEPEPEDEPLPEPQDEATPADEPTATEEPQDADQPDPDAAEAGDEQVEAEEAGDDAEGDTEADAEEEPKSEAAFRGDG